MSKDKTKIVQVVLKNKMNESLITWVDVRPGLVIGNYVTLKDLKPDTKWQILAVFSDIEQEANAFDWHRKWDNNI
jgi:hypothetical protein